MIKVTVIVPVYNTSKYLRRCLDSLVNQTLKEIEILVINDCSTDNSKDILEEYQKKYENIKVFHNKINKGIGYNRNLGVQKANGKYLSFIDSDDWVDETMFDKMYGKAIKDNNDIVICNFYKMLEVNNDLSEMEINVINSKYDNTTLNKSPDLLLNVNLAPWNKLYKKELFTNDVKFPENLKYEDAIVVIKTLSRAKKIGIVEDKLNYYLVRSKSETTIMDKRVFDILEITKQIIEELKKHKYYEEISEYVEAWCIRNLFRYTLQQRYQKDDEIKNKFIDEVFEYLNITFPNWNKNTIWKKRSILKRTIEKNKTLTKIYCKILKA